MVNSNLHLSIQTSRLVNERITYAGLTQEDLLAIVASFFQLFAVLGALDYSLLAVPIVITEAALLISIRLRFRRRKIRDFCRFQYLQIFKNGVIYDPSNRRYN